MRFRALASLLAVALLLGGCGDDGDGATSTSSTPATGPPTSGPVTSGTIAGPTQGQLACADLADRYVRRARRLFERDGTPSDALVDRTRARLNELDTIAGAAGCGDEYRNGVCDGLDALATEGVLVIMPLLPPNGC